MGKIKQFLKRIKGAITYGWRCTAPETGMCVICGNESEWGSIISIGFICGDCWNRLWIWGLNKSHEEYLESGHIIKTKTIKKRDKK